MNNLESQATEEINGQLQEVLEENGFTLDDEAIQQERTAVYTNGLVRISLSCEEAKQEPVGGRPVDAACKAIKGTLLASGWEFADYQPAMTGEEILTFTGKNDENLQVIVTLEEVEEMEEE